MIAIGRLSEEILGLTDAEGGLGMTKGNTVS